MGDFEIDERVDITDVVCPMTFVKAKVAMEELEIGQVLAVTMNDGEPVQNGHDIEDIHPLLRQRERHIRSDREEGRRVGGSDGKTSRNRRV